MGSKTNMMSRIAIEQLTEGPRESPENAISVDINKKVIMTKIWSLVFIYSSEAILWHKEISLFTGFWFVLSFKYKLVSL